MAVPAASGPISYFDYFNGINEPSVKEIVNSYIKHKMIYTHFPIQTVNTLKRKSKRIIGGLPVPTSLPIGAEPPTPFMTNFEDYEETPYMFRDNFDGDEVYWTVGDDWIEGDPITKQMEAYFEGLAFYVNNCFINNFHTDGPIRDVNTIEGIKYRLAYPAKWGNSASVSLKATADLSDAGLGISSAVQIERDIEQLLGRMGRSDGEGVVFLASGNLWRQLNADIKSAGYSGGFKSTQDAFDREIMGFKKASLVDVGYQAPAVDGVQQTPVIDSAQDQNGWSPGDSQYNPIGNVGAKGTSIYAVVGGEKTFSTWQIKDPSVRKVFPISGTRKNRVMFDHFTGLWNPDTRGIGRLYGIKTNGPSGD